MKTLNPVRQRFINVMYLILIAMMLLNVRVEFIEPFTDLNRTLERANYRLEQRSTHTVNTLSRLFNIDTTNYQRIYDRIAEAHMISDSAIRVLDTLKTEIIRRTGGYENGHLRNAGKSPLATRMMIHESRADSILSLLEFTKEKLIYLFDEPNQLLLDTVLITEDSLVNANGIFIPWTEYFFDRKPLGATVALFSKFEHDVRIAESIVVNSFYNELENAMKDVISVPDSTGRIDSVLVAPGPRIDDYIYNINEDAQAQIKMPQLKNNIDQYAVIYQYDEKGAVMDSFILKNGLGEITIKTDRVGEFKIKGVIRMREKDRKKDDKKDDESAKKHDIDKFKNKERKKDITEYPFEFNYKVVNPQPMISRGTINALYTGLDNKVKVAHPSYPADRYKVTMYPGKIIKGPDGYYAHVTKPGYATVSLEIKNELGKYVKVASQKFAVKTLPKPRVKLYGKSEGNPNIYGKGGGRVSEKILKLQKGLAADLSELDIEGKFRVVSFDAIYVNGQGDGIFKEEVKGSYFTGKSRTLIDLAKPGDLVIFDNILVKGPDGKNLRADALVFTIE